VSSSQLVQSIEKRVSQILSSWKVDVSRLGLATINLQTKLKVSNYTHYEDMRSGAKCTNWGSLGRLGVTQGHPQCHHSIERMWRAAGSCCWIGLAPSTGAASLSHYRLTAYSAPPNLVEIFNCIYLFTSRSIMNTIGPWLGYPKPIAGAWGGTTASGVEKGGIGRPRSHEPSSLLFWQNANATILIYLLCIFDATDCLTTSSGLTRNFVLFNTLGLLCIFVRFQQTQ